jgi:uncharacterized protein (UPF0332 family)
MSLVDDLLAQARQLAKKEPRRPKQASLRRAVSTAYYGLFHELISTGTRFLVGGRERKRMRCLLSREFEHGAMRGAAKTFIGTSTNAWAGLLEAPVSPDLNEVAGAFVDLQSHRHTADYDVDVRFTRSNVLTLVSRAELAVHTMRRISGTHEAECFLLALQFRGRRGA